MTTETTTAEQEQVNLELRDIAAMLQIINIVSQRGAIRAEEMAEVGAIYNKVNAFLQASLPPSPENGEEAPAEEAPAAAE